MSRKERPKVFSIYLQQIHTHRYNFWQATSLIYWETISGTNAHVT